MNDVDTLRFVRRHAMRHVAQGKQPHISTRQGGPSVRNFQPLRLHHDVSLRTRPSVDDGNIQGVRISSGRHRGVLYDLSANLESIADDQISTAAEKFTSLQALSPSVPRFGSFNTDPFIRYPVHMDHRTRILVSRSMFEPSDSMLTVQPKLT